MHLKNTFPKSLIALSIAMASSLAIAAPTPSEKELNNPSSAAQQESITVFHNVNIFDGTQDKLHQGYSVAVTGNKITAIEKGNLTAPEQAKVIDGEGRTLMPALVESHMHLALPKGLLGTDDMRWNEIAIHAQAFAEMYLDLGFRHDP